MNVAALRLVNHDTDAARSTDARLARVAVFDSFAEAEPHWRALERGDTLSTPYQRYDFLRLWYKHVGASEGLTPYLVVGFDAAGRALFLWPMGLRQLAGLKVVEFLGGKHANYNMALWRGDVAARVDAAMLRAVLRQLGDSADLVALTNQPLRFGGADNPFALLPWQRSANSAFSGALMPDFEALMEARTNASGRKKMRKKERSLARHGTVRFARARGFAAIGTVLEAFFAQKAARFRVQGLPDVFADAGVRRFIETAAVTARPDGGTVLELYALSVNDTVLATMGGVAGNGRFSAMFNSYLAGPLAVESPGEQLLVNLVRELCEQGFDTFDLGTGDAHYKGLFCGDAEALFDSFWALSPAGRLAAPGFRTAAAAKRFIKQNDAVWSLVSGARRLRARLLTRPPSPPLPPPA